MMTGRTVLIWLERGLLAAGTALAIWCAVVMIESRRTSSMPVPAATGTTGTLPGDSSSVPRPPPDAGAWIARLEAPSVHLAATVLEGTDDAILNRAAGHIEETALPGSQGNIGIAGHRDTIFRPVRKLHTGDPLVLTTADRVYRYRVSKMHIVDPDDVYVLDPVGHPILTLVTCYPFEFIGHAPRRYIVRADLVREEPRTAGP